MAYTLSLKFKPQELRQLKASLADRASIVKIDKAIRLGLAYSIRALKTRTPKKTGMLGKAWAGARNLGPGKWVLENPLPYAAPIEYGAKGHVIRARKKPFLHFKIDRPSGTVWVRTKKVDHPGNRPYEMLRKTLPEIRFRVMAGIRRVLARVVR